MTNDTKLISIKKAAQILGVTPLTLRNWDKKGKLKALRHPMNNYRVYKREEVEKLMESMSYSAPAAAPVRKIKGPKKLEVRHLEN
ncbi:MAG: yhdJ [Candidatus Parcubacteria bacterium]|nr:yhdJ [Candidatus Parcubacteria bacterium]